MTSIRRKLTLLAALLAAGFSAAAATFFSAQAEFNDFLDAHLRETAESLADSVRSSMPMHAPEHLTIIGDAPSYRIIVQVYDSANNSLWQRENTPALPLPDGPGFGLSKVDGRDWRTYSVAVGPLVITAGQDLAVRTSLAATASFRILQPPSVHCYCCLDCRRQRIGTFGTYGTFYRTAITNVSAANFYKRFVL